MIDNQYDIEFKNAYQTREEAIMQETMLDEQQQGTSYQYDDMSKFDNSSAALIDVVHHFESDEDGDEEEKVSSHMILAWFACLMCCPLGILAVLKSIQVKISLKRKDHEGAEDSAEATRFFATLAIICGVIILCVLSAIFLGMAADV